MNFYGSKNMATSRRSREACFFNGATLESNVAACLRGVFSTLRH